MLFLAADPENVHCRNEVSALHNNMGQLVHSKQRRVTAQFWRGIPVWALPKAMELFDPQRVPDDWEPRQWFACYDSIVDQGRAGWTDEEREVIETRLQELGYPVVEPEKAPVPYPAYPKHRKIVGKRTLDHAAADIVAALLATGVDLDSVALYEHDHPDANTEALLEAVKKGLGVDAQAEELVSA